MCLWNEINYTSLQADEVLAPNSKREFVIIQDNRKDGEIWVSLKQQEVRLCSRSCLTDKAGSVIMLHRSGGLRMSTWGRNAGLGTRGRYC